MEWNVILLDTYCKYSMSIFILIYSAIAALALEYCTRFAYGCTRATPDSIHTHCLFAPSRPYPSS